VVCLSPTYELALQTGEVASKMSQFAPELSIRYAVRGETMPKGSRLSDHIIIGTPGKVLDWGLKFRFFDLLKIRVFVLDEADVMIDTQGYQDQSIRIWKGLSPDCQMLLFSATYDKDVMNFAENIIKDPVIIRLKREEESLDNIGQYWAQCETPEAKYTAIDNLYGVITIGQAIIFCQTRKTASWLATKLVKDGHAVAMLSGELSIEERIMVLDRFREGNEKILITTNVMARGIDVEAVTIVVNYDLPVDINGKADCETYLHRIGRTGRFGKRGLAINLIDGPEAMKVMEDIQTHFNRPILNLNTEDADEIEKIQK